VTSRVGRFPETQKMNWLAAGLRKRGIFLFGRDPV
jgi:hypothetical protein